MKKYFLISLLIFSAISFTGCGTKNIAYDKYNIERDLNSNISKIDNKSIKIVDLSQQKIVRKLGNKSYSFVTYELEASKMNTEISKEFFKQYFNLVESGEELFTVESKITDYSITGGTGNPNNLNVDLTLDIKVIKNGKTILNKTYSKRASGVTVWEWRLTLDETTFRKLQKGVLSIYENEFKADLLKALKENK